MSRLASTVVLLAAAVCAAAPVHGVQDEPAGRRLDPELLWDLRRVSGPSVSPDGSRLVYHVRTYDLEEDRGATHLFLMDLDSGERRQLTGQGSNWGVVWSPDGERIAFLSSRDGAPQIYLMDLGGGEAQPVTDREGGCANLQWSPDGKHFSFTSQVREADDPKALFEDLPKAEARVYDDLLIRHWDHWKEGTFSHLFVVGIDGEGERDLMEGQPWDTPLVPFGGGEQIGWAPDGSRIAYTAKKVDDPEVSTDSDIFEVDLTSGETTNLTDGMGGFDIDPVYSPDGTRMAWLSMERPGFESDRNRIFVRDRVAGTATEITVGFDQNASGPAWSPDSQTIWFTTDRHGTTQIYGVAADGGSRPKAATSGRWHFGGLNVGPGGDALYATRMQTERPNEIVRVALGGEASEGTALSDENGDIYASLALPTVLERWTKATDGQSIHSWIVYPPDFDPSKKYPMLTYCQGGPQGQVGQWFSYRWNFHLMAAQGYIVAAINRRGLPGFGRAWNDQISGDWGGQAMQDLLSVTDDLFTEPYVDRDRTAAIGASFGGYTTFWLMGHDEEDRFKAMVSHCGVFNLESMYLSTEELWFPNWDAGGPYWRMNASEREKLAAFSPHRHVEKWDTPLLVIHGQRDYRVPFEQGLQAFTAAQVQGVPSRLLYYPNEGHWIMRPQNGVLWHRVFFDWLGRYCGGGS